MPNVITLHSFAFFVQFADLKIDTCKFSHKTYFALKLTVSQSPQFMLTVSWLKHINCCTFKDHPMDILTLYCYLPIMHGLGFIHNPPNPFYSLLIVSLWLIQGLKFILKPFIGNFGCFIWVSAVLHAWHLK